MMKVIFCVVVLCALAWSLPTSDFPEAPEDGNCETGKTYKQQCNICQCVNGKIAGCTYALCASNDEPQPEPECSDTDTKKEKCNNCRCLKGQWACTKMTCVDPPTL